MPDASTIAIAAYLIAEHEATRDEINAVIANVMGRAYPSTTTAVLDHLDTELMSVRETMKEEA